MDVVRAKRFEHGFTLLTMVPSEVDLANSSGVFYTLYQGPAFSFASPSLERTIEHMLDLNCAFNSALHIGKDERVQLALPVADGELDASKSSLDLDFYRQSVTRHEHEIRYALRREQRHYEEDSLCI